MNITGIRSDLEVIEGDVRLYEETNFNNRADALDFLEFHIIDRIEGLDQYAGREELEELRQRAEKLRYQLGKIDSNLFRQLREKIRAGMFTGAAFRKMVCQYLGDYGDGNDQAEKMGYDNLDIFINGLFSDQVIPEATIEREPEMVFYQKTPARIVFELAELTEWRQEDVFFDLGSGLGQAVLLVHLISGAIARGIEYEPAYCSYATTCVSRLNLPDVTFLNIDARKGDYSEGTVFFMYTPFEGSMLQDMLELLQKEAEKRTIRIFTYGPCSSSVARQDWLTGVKGESENPDQLCVFRSRDKRHSATAFAYRATV